MSTKLYFQAIIKFLLGLMLVGALVFVPAGYTWIYNIICYFLYVSVYSG